MTLASLPLAGSDMTRRRKDPLRPLTDHERRELTLLSRSRTAPAAEVTRAQLLLAVADGADYQAAARAAGRRSGDAVARLVSRFNVEGLDAIRPRHGGGRPATYDQQARERILREARRAPTPEADGTAAWSLSTLRKALRAAPDGLPTVSTYTLWQVLHQANYTYQRTRSWCPTGEALRKRKAGAVTVTDPDAEAKKS
jgi:transposase